MPRLNKIIGSSKAAAIPTKELEDELAYRRTGSDFPLHVFNPAFRNAAVIAVENYHLPRAFVGLAILAATASAVGSAYWVRAGEFTDPLTVWGSMVGISSQGKSLSQKLFYRPIETIQRKLDAEYEANKMATELVNESEKAAGKKPWETTQADRPTLLNQSDTTYEAFIRQVVAKNPKGICKIVEEQVEWIYAMSLYAKGDGIEKQFWLKAWSPAGPYIQVRSGKETMIKKEHLSIQVFGGIQPDLLYKFFDKGLLEMGMSNRILFALPQDYTLHAPNLKYKMPEGVMSDYCRAVERLYDELPMRGPMSTPYYADISREGLDIISAFNQELLDNVNGIFDMKRKGVMSGAMGKVNQYVNRFTVLLALQDASAEGRDLQHLTDIGADYALRAVELGRYFYSSFENAYDIAKRTLQIPTDVLAMAAHVKAANYNIKKAAAAAGVGYDKFRRMYQTNKSIYPKAFGADNT